MVPPSIIKYKQTVCHIIKMACQWKQQRITIHLHMCNFPASPVVRKIIKWKGIFAQWTISACSPPTPLSPPHFQRSSRCGENLLNLFQDWSVWVHRLKTSTLPFWVILSHLGERKKKTSHLALLLFSITIILYCDPPPLEICSKPSRLQWRCSELIRTQETWDRPLLHLSCSISPKLNLTQSSHQSPSTHPFYSIFPQLTLQLICKPLASRAAWLRNLL